MEAFWFCRSGNCEQSERSGIWSDVGPQGHVSSEWDYSGNISLERYLVLIASRSREVRCDPCIYPDLFGVFW